MGEIKQALIRQLSLVSRLQGQQLPHGRNRFSLFNFTVTGNENRTKLLNINA